MKVHPVTLLCVCLFLLLCGCGVAKKPLAPPVPGQPETGGEALDIASFSFWQTASFAGDCFRLELIREEKGTRVCAEELFSGGRVVDTVIRDGVLEQLGSLVGNCRVDRWDGFDRSSSRVSDGSSFTLAITLADGGTISAHGNNAFPDNYAEVYAAVRALYNDLMEQYGPHG